MKVKATHVQTAFAVTACLVGAALLVWGVAAAIHLYWVEHPDLTRRAVLLRHPDRVVRYVGLDLAGLFFLWLGVKSASD